ncbi:MAG: polysaccharide biosynthesis/export family protein [Vicingaceae bacterium]
MKKTLFLVIAALSLMACNRTYRSSMMLKAPKDYDYSQALDTTNDNEFRLAPNDIIDFRLFTNDGFKLIDLSTMNDNNGQRLTQQQNNFFYLIEYDGMVKLPMIGRVNLSGMTIKETEEFLQDKYSKYYIDPFARITATNRRVVVFTGEYSQGTVVDMENRNMTLLEGLARAGGIPRSGKAHTIKLIRGDRKNPEIFFINLSKIEGMAQASIILQSNDIIYVEPRISLSSEILRDWAPVIAVATSVLTLYILITNLPSN